MAKKKKTKFGPIIAAVACPKCGVAEGGYCINNKGKAWYSDVHAARRDLFLGKPKTKVTTKLLDLTPPVQHGMVWIQDCEPPAVDLTVTLQVKLELEAVNASLFQNEDTVVMKELAINHLYSGEPEFCMEDIELISVKATRFYGGS